MILVGLWCNKEKPTMNMFLKPLADAANEIYNEGKKKGLYTQYINKLLIFI